MLRLICTENYDEMSRRAALMIASQVIAKEDSVLGLATGSTPIGTYAQLAAMHDAGDLDFAKIRTANLDEYRGLPADHDQSYRYFMEKHLFSKVNIKPENIHIPNGCAEDTAAECSAYDELIRSMGGIDLQLLGLGHNCHIGFNEPSDRFVKETHEVQLTERTIEANSRLFDDISQVPRAALTMGIGAIFSAKRVLVIVSGADKAEAVKNSFFGPITPNAQASILQLHPDVTVIADKEAAGGLF